MISAFLHWKAGFSLCICMKFCLKQNRNAL
jgi:hypothetical protein